MNDECQRRILWPGRHQNAIDKKTILYVNAQNMSSALSHTLTYKIAGITKENNLSLELYCKDLCFHF